MLLITLEKGLSFVSSNDATVLIVNFCCYGTLKIEHLFESGTRPTGILLLDERLIWKPET